MLSLCKLNINQLVGVSVHPCLTGDRSYDIVRLFERSSRDRPNHGEKAGTGKQPRRYHGRLIYMKAAMIESAARNAMENIDGRYCHTSSPISTKTMRTTKCVRQKNGHCHLLACDPSTTLPDRLDLSSSASWPDLFSQEKCRGCFFYLRQILHAASNKTRAVSANA